MNTLTKLKSLYQQLDNNSAAGEDVVADLKREIRNLELAYLKDEVLPNLAHYLGSQINDLRCEIDCSIQYDEDGKINYSFCTSGSSLLVKDSIDAKDCVNSIGKILNLKDSLNVVSQEYSGNVRIVEYSEKAIAVYGNTKQFSDIFKTKGGYFNPRLKEGAGWIFSKKIEKELRVLLKPYIEEEKSQDEGNGFKSNNKATLNSKGRVYYSLNGGGPMNKRQVVFAAVKKYHELNPNLTFQQIREAFPDILQGSFGVVAPLTYIERRIMLGYKFDNKYFMGEKEILKSSDGIKFAVCNQWGNQFNKFQSHIAQKLGWSICEVNTENKITTGNSNKNSIFDNLDFAEEISSENSTNASNALQYNQTYKYNINIKPYSNRFILAYGDTEPLSREFGILGGSFNSQLEDGTAWLFPKYREEEIRNLIENKGKLHNEDIIVSRKNKNVTNAKTLYKYSILEAQKLEQKYRLANSSIEKFLKYFDKLRISTITKANGPQIVILLLTIFECIKDKTINSSIVEFSHYLVSKYYEIWNKYIGGALTQYPGHTFIQLGEERFFSLEMKQPIKESRISWNKVMIDKYVKYGILDSLLYSLLLNQEILKFYEQFLVNRFINLYKSK